MKIILKFNEEYAFLSNYFPARIWYDDDIYPSVENAYQAAKFTKDYRKKFFNCKPGQAKKAARINSLLIRKEFERDKLDIMKNLVFQKFSRNGKLKKKLLKTKNSILIEGTTWHDIFWGVDLEKPCKECEFKYEGKNILGKILMEIRKELYNSYNQH